MAKFERARSEEQKEIRIAEILTAAKSLYEKQEFEDITLAAIAKQANFTRSNLYKYFTSREEIFLVIFETDLGNWAEDVQDSLSGQELSIEEFATLWTATFKRHARLQSLYSYLYLFLEKNSPMDRLVRFKSRAGEHFDTLAALLMGIFPGLSRERAIEFLYLQIALMNGIRPLSGQTPIQQEAGQKAGFTMPESQGQAYVKDAVIFILQGMLGTSAEPEKEAAPRHGATFSLSKG